MSQWNRYPNILIPHLPDTAKLEILHCIPGRVRGSTVCRAHPIFRPSASKPIEVWWSVLGSSPAFRKRCVDSHRVFPWPRVRVRWWDPTVKRLQARAADKQTEFKFSGKASGGTVPNVGKHGCKVCLKAEGWQLLDGYSNTLWWAHLINGDQHPVVADRCLKQVIHTWGGRSVEDAMLL